MRIAARRAPECSRFPTAKRTITSCATTCRITIAGHRLRAAFGTDARPVGLDSDRWNLPRYVCGRDWRSPDALVQFLESHN